MKEDVKPDFISTQVSNVQYYFLNLKPARTEELVVVCGGYEQCKPTYRNERKDFQFYSIEYVSEGKGTYEVNGKTYELRPGMLIFYGPGIPHVITTDKENLLGKYFVDFAGQKASELLRESPLAKENIVQASEPGRVEDIFRNLQYNGARDTAYTREICLTLLNLLLLKIAETAVPYGSVDTRGLTTYQRCKKFIDQHFLEIHSLEEIAAGCFINVSYLCRNFKRFGNITPYQYLMRLKMNHAAKLLLGSNLLIKQVAEELGFSDPYHFSRAFKNVYRISPEQFLKVGFRDNSSP